MSVENWHADALASDLRLLSLDDLAIFDMSPNLERLLLALLFFSADVRNDIFYHLWPRLKVLACARNRLICRDYALIRLEFLPCLKCWNVALDGAIWLDCNESVSCAQSLLLMLDNVKMLWVNLWDNHWNVWRPAVCAVVRNNRSLRLCVSFLDCPDFFLCHVNCTENKVNRSRNLLNFVNVHQNHILNALRNRCVKLPSSLNGLLIGLSCTAAARCERYDLEPRMILQKRNKALSNHACSTQNSNF